MAMHHLTTSMFAKANVPSLNEVLKGNPELAKTFTAAALSSMANNGDKMAGNFMNFNNTMNQQNNQNSGQMKGPTTNIDEIMNSLENDDIENLSILGSESSSDDSINDLLKKKNNRKNRRRRSLNI
jgi:hypothetical protein